MEFRKDAFVLFNIIFRLVLLIGLINEQEAPNSKASSPLLNWNLPTVDRLVLIIANGLRDDFLDEGATPYLAKIADEIGSYRRVRVPGITTKDAALRTLLSGVPSHSALLFWNRPEKYRTLLDYYACKCVYGNLPLSQRPECSVPSKSQASVFENFIKTVERHIAGECIYVLSFDFDKVTENNYKRKLTRLDEDVKTLVSVVDDTWLDSDTVFVLTSARGWSVANRMWSTPDVPLLVWGEGIKHTENDAYLNLPDVTALVTGLTGTTHAAGATGMIPINFINITAEEKFQMLLYNMDHLLKSLDSKRWSPVFEAFRAKETFDADMVDDLEASLASMLQNSDAVRLNRVKSATIATAFCLSLWMLLHIAAAGRGTMSFKFGTTAVLGVAALVAIFVFLEWCRLQYALIVLTVVLFRSLSTSSMPTFRDSIRMCLIALSGSAVACFVSFVGIQLSIIVGSTIVISWPVYTRLYKRINRKMLVTWLLSNVLLGYLQYEPVIGRTPNSFLIRIGGLSTAVFIHLSLRNFRRPIDLCVRIATAFLLLATIHQPLLSSLFGPKVKFVCFCIAWLCTICAFVNIISLRGTLMENILKYCLSMSIPFQLLSIRYETFFYLALTMLMLSWLFIENMPADVVLTHRPSLFSFTKSSELSSDGLVLKHYRQSLFFIFFCFLSYFSVGNVANIYTYDMNSVRAFGWFLSDILLSIKFVLPYSVIVFSFVTMNYLQGREPGSLLMFSLFFCDAIAMSILVATLFPDTFPYVNLSHFVLYEIVTISVTFLYAIAKIYI